MAPGIGRRRSLSAASLGRSALPSRDRSRGKRGRAENEQRIARTRNDGIGSALLVAEFNKRCGFIERLDDSADLASDEPVLRQVAEKRDSGEQSRVIALFRLARHPSIRHITMDQGVDQRLIGYPLLQRARLRRTDRAWGCAMRFWRLVLAARAMASISRLRVSVNPLLSGASPSRTPRSKPSPRHGYRPTSGAFFIGFTRQVVRFSAADLGRLQKYPLRRDHFW